MNGDTDGEENDLFSGAEEFEEVIRVFILFNPEVPHLIPHTTHHIVVITGKTKDIGNTVTSRLYGQP